MAPWCKGDQALAQSGKCVWSQQSLLSVPNLTLLWAVLAPANAQAVWLCSAASMPMDDQAVDMDMLASQGAYTRSGG
jgi:hypothetical protein